MATLQEKYVEHYHEMPDLDSYARAMRADGSDSIGLGGVLCSLVMPYWTALFWSLKPSPHPAFMPTFTWACFFCFVLLASSIANLDPSMLAMSLVMYVLPTAAGFVVWRSRRERHEKLVKLVDSAFTALIRDQGRPLLRNRRRALIPDDYGFSEHTKWYAELHHFLVRSGVPARGTWHPKLTKAEVMVGNFEWFQIVDQILDQLEHADVRDLKGPGFVPAMSGTDYESFVADKLKELGWDVSMTKGSGDHGLDVLAKRAGTVVAIQCKQYGQPVGNAAVQQALAAKALERAHVSAVVAPNGFTRQAKELAAQTGCLLLHHDDLTEL